MYTRCFNRESKATHSSTLAWKIPWAEEPGRLQSMGSLRVGHDRATHFLFSLSCIGEGNGNPLQCSCLENPRDEGAWWAAIFGVIQSWTQLKRLSSSTSSRCFSVYFYTSDRCNLFPHRVYSLVKVMLKQIGIFKINLFKITFKNYNK